MSAPSLMRHSAMSTSLSSHALSSSMYMISVSATILDRHRQLIPCNWSQTKVGFIRGSCFSLICLSLRPSVSFSYWISALLCRLILQDLKDLFLECFFLQPCCGTRAGVQQLPHHLKSLMTKNTHFRNNNKTNKTNKPQTFWFWTDNNCSKLPLEPWLCPLCVAVQSWPKQRPEQAPLNGTASS